jgi:hypothetical protein
MSLYLVFGPFRACTDHRTKPRCSKPSGRSETQSVDREEWSSEDPLEVATRAFESVLEATGMPRPSNVIPFRR